MKEWYRKKLNISETQQEINFDIIIKDSVWGHLRASLHHPQVVVRLAIKLAILSVILGFISVYFGICGALSRNITSVSSGLERGSGL